MEKEVGQIRSIKTTFKVEYAFVATSGYEDCDYECVDIRSLYNV